MSPPDAVPPERGQHRNLVHPAPHVLIACLDSPAKKKRNMNIAWASNYKVSGRRVAQPVLNSVVSRLTIG